MKSLPQQLRRGDTIRRAVANLTAEPRRLAEQLDQLFARQADLPVRARAVLGARRRARALARGADHLRLVQVAARLAARALVEIAGALAHFDELLDGVGRQVARAAEHAREYRYLRRVFQGFEAVEGLPHVRAVGDRAVVRHQKRVVVLDERAHRLGQLVGRGRAVLGERDAAER